MPTHYTTIGVAPGATSADIRRAYHAQARRWHPDRFSERKDGDARQAENRMRQLNEAWSVLGDPQRRREYDRELAAAANGATTVGGAVRTDDGVTRIDPRLLDPEFLAARRRAQQDDMEVRHSGVVRVITVLGFFGMMIGIFVFTAYANGSRATAPTTTLPGPDIGVDAGACVRQMSDGGLLEVPCTGSRDGKVVGAREVGGSCPAGTVREVLVREIVVCLGP